MVSPEPPRSTERAARLGAERRGRRPAGQDPESPSGWASVGSRSGGPATESSCCKGIVAIGRRGAETPLGRNFYVRSGFVPTDPFFGTYALETSAGSSLTDWPDHGIVGIHGTNRPELLGQAVSHGCIRVDNAVATRLRTLAPLGTPIDIVR